MPRRSKPDQLTPLELEIMKVLWETGPAPVQAVQEKLTGPKRLAYTTVQTMLNVLLRKGRVRRSLVDRAYHYKPVLTRARAAQDAVGGLVDRLFGGSAEELVMSLVETHQLTPEALRRVQTMLDEVEKTNE